MKKLRFFLNKKLDELMTEQFLNERGGGIDFGSGIVKEHPKLRPIRILKDANIKSNAIRDYFNKYYQSHEETMRHSMKRIQNAWQKKERKFFDITEDFFDGFKFPKGQYIAYASVINCNPRFLKSKTFQFFYKKSVADALHTIAHELLHFIFFDFVERKLKKEIKLLTRDQLWDLSEIFNVIALKSPRFSHIVDRRFVLSYPNHRRYVKKLEKTYKNHQNAEELIRQSINVIKRGE